jgi:hypothetical protein
MNTLNYFLSTLISAIQPEMEISSSIALKTQIDSNECVPFLLVTTRIDHFSNFRLMCCVLQASQAWMDWLMKKRKAFDQRGDMAIAAWAEQQQRDLNVRVRQLSRSKVLEYA